MPIPKVEYQPLPFAQPRYTADTSRLASIVSRGGEQLAQLALQRGQSDALLTARLASILSGGLNAYRERALSREALAQREREKAEDRKFEAEQKRLEREERKAERDTDKETRQRAEDRAAARYAVDQTAPGPVDGALAAFASRFPETAARFTSRQTLPARVTPGAMGEVATGGESFAVLEPNAEQLERSRAMTTQAAEREKDRQASAAARAVDDARQAQALRQQKEYQDASLSIQRQGAETARMNAETTRQRYTGGGVDTVKLGQFATPLDRAVLTITPTKRAPILALAHRLADEGNTEELRSVIRQAAIEGENVDAKNQIRGRMATAAALEDARGLLAEMKKAGVPTNILTGTAEDVARKLGTSTDPSYVAFANQLSDALINYRRAATGVAFSEKESAEYARMFPNYRQTMPVNEAAINGMLRAMRTNDRTYWENKLGKEGAALVLGYTTPGVVSPDNDPAGLLEFLPKPRGGQ